MKTSVQTSSRITRALACAAALLLFIVSVPAKQNPAKIQHYRQINLVSDLPGVAQIQDTNLVNAWGISFNPLSPFWVSDNGTGKSTLYSVTNDSSGTPIVSRVPLVVSIPGEGNPTGQLFNGDTNIFHGDAFIFASEDGTISGWRPALGINVEVLATNSDAVYKGITLSANSSGPVLLVANFSEATVDVYTNGGAGATLAAQFSDLSAPDGYAPFNVQEIDGSIFVTFAKQDDAKEDDVPGRGHGLIDIFDPLSGTFTRFAAGSDAGGKIHDMNSPWGIALAPSTFGRHAGQLLVGNFGSGTIMTFDANGTFEGLLKGVRGGALTIDGLWGLTFGNGARAGTTDTLFFSAGPNGESNGLLGAIQPDKK